MVAENAKPKLRETRVILKGGRFMISRHQERQAQAESTATVGEANHVPDLLFDEVQVEVVDLPRRGIAKDVENVTKATVRLPERLYDESDP